VSSIEQPAHCGVPTTFTVRPCAWSAAALSTISEVVLLTVAINDMNLSDVQGSGCTLLPGQCPSSWTMAGQFLAHFYRGT
jgi:hypothetical protein